MNRKEIVETMERTRGSVFHNGKWYRKPEEVPEDDVLVGDDPANKEVVARDLQAQVDALQNRLNRLRPGLATPERPREELRSSEETDRLKAELDALRAENERLKGASTPESPSESNPEPPAETDGESSSPPQENVQASESSPPEISADEVTGEPTVETPPSHRGRRRGS